MFFICLSVFWQHFPTIKFSCWWWDRGKSGGLRLRVQYRLSEQWEWLGWCRVQNILSWRMTVSSMTANGVIGSVAGHPWMLYRFGMTYDCKQQDLSPWFCICGNRVVDGVSCLPWNRCFCSFCISLDSFHFCVCTDWLTLLPHSYKGKLISIFIIPLR